MLLKEGHIAFFAHPIMLSVIVSRCLPICEDDALLVVFFDLCHAAERVRCLAGFGRYFDEVIGCRRDPR